MSDSNSSSPLEGIGCLVVIAFVFIGMCADRCGGSGQSGGMHEKIEVINLSGSWRAVTTKSNNIRKDIFGSKYNVYYNLEISETGRYNLYYGSPNHEKLERLGMIEKTSNGFIIREFDMGSKADHIIGAFTLDGNHIIESFCTSTTRSGISDCYLKFVRLY